MKFFGFRYSMRYITRPFGEIASNEKSPLSAIVRRTRRVRVSITANVVVLRGKRTRGLISTSVRPSADSPLGDPS